MTTKRERKALAKKVRAAADYIDRVGLHKGALYEGPSLYNGLANAVANGRKVCAVGAIRGQGLRANFGQPDVVDELAAYLAETHPRAEVEYVDGKGRKYASVPDWNDKPSRRKKDVVELLRGFADKLESGQ